MIDFDCIDGIEDINIANHRNLQQQQQVERTLASVTDQVIGASWQRQPSFSSSIRLIIGDEVKNTTTPTISNNPSPPRSSSSSCQSVSHTNTTSSCEGRTLEITSMSSHSPASPQQQQQPPQAIGTAKQATAISTTTAWRRNDDLVSCLFITANVGTIFEESTLLELWFQQLKDYLIKIKPHLVAIHCQEVGGKNYESSMKNVSTFTDKILGDDDIIGDYSRVRIFLDDNYECLEKFTALGSLYLIHDSVQCVKLYNFKTAQYDSIQGRVIHKDNSGSATTLSNNVTKRSITTANSADVTLSGSPTTKKNENNNIIAVEKAALPPLQQTGSCEHVEKIKFPQELFPECRWSRKGFMRTRWLFNGSHLLDLVNIHLFHDASNLIAMKTTPSPYAQNRQRALEFALKKLSAPLSGQHQQEVPLFIFGDFNFRLDTNKVIQRITEGVPPIIKRNIDSDEVVEFVYHRKPGAILEKPTTNALETENQLRGNVKNEETIAENDENVVMTIGKKLFDCENLDEMFRATKNTEWLQELDIELNSFKNQLYEFKISFSPSYPFKEDESGGYSYMKTRCPAWCDRILFNSAGNRMIYSRGQDAANCLDSERRIELLQNQGDIIYRLMGNTVPMGDHKPVLLYCQLDLSKTSIQNVSTESIGILQTASSLSPSTVNKIPECNQVEQSRTSETSSNNAGTKTSAVATSSRCETSPNGALIESTSM